MYRLVWTFDWIKCQGNTFSELPQAESIFWMLILRTATFCHFLRTAQVSVNVEQTGMIFNTKLNTVKREYEAEFWVNEVIFDIWGLEYDLNRAKLDGLIG